MVTSELLGASSRPTYRPLAADAPEIRLLRIHKGHCSLEHVRLDSANNFVYLAWAKEKNDQDTTLQIDRSTVVIPSTLHKALQAACSSSEDRIWVEDICIDRPNIDDWDLHIRLRPKILKLASRLTCYVGDRDLHSSAAIALLQTEFRDLGTDSKAYEEATESLQNFFSRPIWKKLSTFQEFALANDVRISDGIDNHDWNSITNTLWDMQRQMYETPIFAPQALRDVSCVNNVRYRQVSSGWTWRLPVVDAITWTLCLSTEDPRERLFSLFGVCFDAEEMILRPSYSDSVEKVFGDFTKAMIREWGMQTLCLAPSSEPRRSRTENLPSWIPDWDSFHKELTLQQEQMLEQYLKFKTLGEFSPGSETTISQSLRPNALTVRILVVGSVDGITSVVDEQIPKPLVPSQHWKNQQGEHPSWNTEESVLGSIMSCLTPGGHFWFTDSQGREMGNSSCVQTMRKCFLHLWKRGSLNSSISDNDYRALLGNWLETNAGLHIHGQELRDWSNASFNLHPSCDDFVWVPEPPEPQHFHLFLNKIKPFFKRRMRLFVTDKGRVGAAEGEVQQGDKVCWIQGARMPFLLREVEVDGRGRGHLLVGSCQQTEDYGSPIWTFVRGKGWNDRFWEQLDSQGYWVETIDLV